MYHNGDGDSIVVTADPTGPTTFSIANDTPLYVARVSDDLIGIQTFKVGIGRVVACSERMKGDESRWFKTMKIEQHRFEILSVITTNLCIAKKTLTQKVNFSHDFNWE